MRTAVLLIVGAGALAVPATPALAHGGGPADAPAMATAFRVIVTGVTPAEPGLRVRAVQAGTRIELTNETGHSVEVLGYSGEPYLDVRPDGTYQNVSSPTAYLNRTAAGDGSVPAGADPTAPPIWRRLSGSTTVRWPDHRTQWLTAGLPSAAAADPSHSHRLRDWSIPLREQVRTFEVRGTLDWVPPPPAWPWWAAAGLIALAAFLVGGPVALIGGFAVIWYGTTKTLAVQSLDVVLVVTAVLALLAALRRTPLLCAIGGAVLAVFGGLAQLSVFSAAVLPVAGPAWAARLAVTVAIGTGAGLAAAGVRRLRGAPVQVAPERQTAGLSSSA